jgi:hypothetical protein
LLYSTLLALGGGADGVTKLPDSAVPRSNQDLLYSIMLAAQGIGGGSSLSISSQAQAEGGTDNTTAMSPLRVNQRLALTFGAPTTVGRALLNLTNPGAISFLRLNADNTVSALSAADMRTALALGTIATQAASNVAITGGSINGLSAFESSDPDFTVDSHGNLTAKYFKLTNSGSGQTSLHLAVVSGAVPSTPSSFSEVLRLSGGVLYLSPATTGTVISGPMYLGGGRETVLNGGTNTLQIGHTSSSPSAQCFKGTDGSGSNIVGGKLSLAPGRSTGNATPGKLALQGTAGGSSGSTSQTLADVLTVWNASYIMLGDATVAGTLIIGVAASGLTIGQSSGTALGFWGASPVGQYNTEGIGGIYSAGSGTPVLDDSKFTGGMGSKAYTLNDVVAALKACGMMES